MRVAILGMYWPRQIVLMLLGLSWCASIIAFPWIIRLGHLRVGFLISFFFSNLCHQNPYRSFVMMGLPLPVCSRCTALYLGGLAGVTLYPALRLLGERLWIQALFCLAAFLMIMDVELDWMGTRKNTFLSRSLTGSILGLCCGVCLTWGVQRMGQRGRVIAPSADSTVLTPLKSPLGKGGTIRSD